MHPLETPITRTNKLTWVAMSIAGLAWVGVLAGGGLEIGLCTYPGTINSFTNMYCYLLLIGMVSITVSCSSFSSSWKKRFL